MSSNTPPIFPGGNPGFNQAQREWIETARCGLPLPGQPPASVRDAKAAERRRKVEELAARGATVGEREAAKSVLGRIKK